MSIPSLSTKMINSEFYYKKEDSIRSIQSASHCSCSQCELNDCFTLRNKNSPSDCTCNACKLAKSKTDSDKPLKNHNKLVKINADSNETLKDPKKIIPDIQSSTRIDSESKIKSKIIEIKKEIFPEMTDNEFSIIDDSKYTEYRSKDVSIKKDKLDWNEDKQVYEKSSTKKYIHSVAITYSPKDCENSTVKLSAQVMDMPYEEVKDSLATDNNNKVAEPVDLPYAEFKDTLPKDNVPNIETQYETTPSPPNIIDLIKPDILTRLREIYRACSCKVCECITGKPLIPYNESCKCSPCDCEQCAKIRNKLKDDIIKPPHSGCPCVRCDRKDCRGVVKNTGDAKCDCKPCECIKCVENFPKSCNCQPCQCTECIGLGLSLPRSFVVAPVQGSFRQNMCQCEPCECDNCTHNYSAMSSNLRRDISTDVSHGNCPCDSCSNNSCETNNSCRCDVQNKIAKKPLNNSAPDYDIQRTVVSYRDKNRSKIRNQDTIAMYALSNNYSKIIENTKIDDNCQCLNCECFACNAKLPYNDENKRTHCETIEIESGLSTDLSSTCKCSPCDCRICNKHNKQKNELGDKCLQKYCVCKGCDCLICRGLLQYSKNEKNITNHLYHEVPYSPLQETFIVPKKGRILTPSTFEANIRSTSKIQNQVDNEYVHLNKTLSTKLSRYKKVTVWHTKSKQNVPCEPSFCYETINPINSQILNVSGDKISDSKRNFVLSKSNAENPLKLDDIFNPSKQSPIRNIDLLNECIYLVKSNDKIDSEDDFNISLTHSENIMQTPNVFQHTLNKTIDSEKLDVINIDNDESHLIINNQMEILDKVSSKSNKFCDKKLYIESEIRDLVEDITFKRDLKHRDELNQSLISPNEFLVSTDPKKEIVVVPIEHNEVESCDTKYTHKNLSKYNIYNRTVKPKRYCRMYRKLKKEKKDKVTKSLNVTNYQANVKESEANNDILTIIDKLISSLESEINNIENLALMTKKNLHVTENIFIRKMDEKQDEKGKSCKSWPILKNNLYTTCTQAYKKSDCGVFAMESDSAKNVESISMQTSDLCHNNKTKNGKEALTLLLNEVKDLLNSPLLSSRSSQQSADLRQTSDFLLKNAMDPKYKSIYSDAVSQTIKNRIPVDKETMCNFLQPMESLYKSMKQLVDLVLARAAYKSEITTMKYNFIHGCSEEISNINSARSSCEGLRAAFIGLRTISDHTVMVKWKIPRQVLHVQGYELQVDGRPVQKIFSPTRCMAVLTCLPHTDKLLLTIRTITTNLPSDHNPTTTIVYRPHVK